MFDIIHDAEKDVAALIDPELGRALGPVLSGEGAADMLETFAGALGVDPTKLPVHTIERRWEDFVKALTDTKDLAAAAEKEGAGESVAEPQAAAQSETAGVDTALPPADPADKGATPGAAVGESPAAEGGATDGAAEGESPEAPVQTPKEGNSVCPTCSGFRTVPQGGTVVECPTCDGKGEVLAAQPEPTA